MLVILFFNAWLNDAWRRHSVDRQLNADWNGELRGKDSRVTILRSLARFHTRWESESILRCKMSLEKGASLTKKQQKAKKPPMPRPHAVTLDWHLFGAFYHSAVFEWGACLFVFALGFFWCMWRSRFEDPGPDKSSAPVVAFDAFIVRVLRSSQHFYFFYLFSFFLIWDATKVVLSGCGAAVAKKLIP